jgi:hypothetical protein
MKQEKKNTEGRMKKEKERKKERRSVFFRLVCV